MSGIVVAPFSNSDIRDWPASHYAALIARLVERWDSPPPVRVIGTTSQRLRAATIVRHLDPALVSNECGRLTWPEVIGELRAATCVIGNNSGVAHLAGSFGVPTVCIFSGSHQRLEWRPMGFSVVLLSRVIACSPCHLDHGASCPYGKACLTEIEPDVVADTVLRVCRPGGPYRSETGETAKGELQTGAWDVRT